MAGYKEYSMSNNAIAAYEAGEKPLSRWTKQAIIEEIEQAGIPADALESAREMTAGALKRYLKYSGWHHTGSKYRWTAFYTVDIDRLLSSAGYTERMQVLTPDGPKTGTWEDRKPEGLGFLSFLADDGVKYPIDDVSFMNFVYVKKGE